VTFKGNSLPPEVGVVDLELGGMDCLTYHAWITDTTVDDGEGWGYLKKTGYKSVTTLIHYLVDNVSKNGHLLLNIGPKPDGTLPEQAKDILKGMGKWLEINGEAIFGTTNWTFFGEGPHQVQMAGPFSEEKLPVFTGEDIRFTVKSNALCVISLGWPGEEIVIEALKCLYPAEILSVRMLGVEQELEWSLTHKAMHIRPPVKRPCEHAYVIKITRGRPYPSSQ
jgi:alpha-L-fucosidase